MLDSSIEGVFPVHSLAKFFHAAACKLIFFLPFGGLVCCSASSCIKFNNRGGQASSIKLV